MYRELKSEHMCLQYGLYQSSRSGRGYSGSSRGEAAAAAAAAASFQPQLVSSILCPPPYQGLASPGKHVTVVTQQPQLQLQPSLLPQQVGYCLQSNGISGNGLLSSPI